MKKKDWEQRLSIDKELRILWKLCLGLEENVKSVKKYVKRVETARYQQKNTQPQTGEKSTFEDGVDFKEEVIKMKHKFEDTPEEKEEWEERFVKRFGYWGSEIDFIKDLLLEREREAEKNLLKRFYNVISKEEFRDVLDKLNK